MSTYVVPGVDVSDMKCRYVMPDPVSRSAPFTFCATFTFCDDPAHCMVKNVTDGQEEYRYPVCYAHFVKMMHGDNNRPFVAARGTAEAAETGEYEVSAAEANPDAAAFTLESVDCNQCGKTHANVTFEAVDPPYLVRSQGGITATVTHHATCPETGARIVFGRAPRNGDF